MHKCKKIRSTTCFWGARYRTTREIFVCDDEFAVLTESPILILCVVRVHCRAAARRIVTRLKGDDGCPDIAYRRTEGLVCGP